MSGKNKRGDKEVVRPGEEASWLPGELGARIQAQIDGIGEDPQIELLGPPTKRKKNIALMIRQIRDIQQTLDDEKASRIFAGRRPVKLFPYVMMPLELLLADNIEPLDKLVWLVLFRHALDKKTAWPSQERIGEELSRSKRMIQRSLDKLEKGGYISRRLRRISGRMDHNEYELNLEIEKSRGER
jgi:biotin operon repressor